MWQRKQILINIEIDSIKLLLSQNVCTDKKYKNVTEQRARWYFFGAHKTN